MDKINRIKKPKPFLIGKELGTKDLLRRLACQVEKPLIKAAGTRVAVPLEQTTIG